MLNSYEKMPIVSRITVVDSTVSRKVKSIRMMIMSYVHKCCALLVNYATYQRYKCHTGFDNFYLKSIGIGSVG